MTETSEILEGSQMYVCDNCGKLYEVDDELTGANWFIVDTKIKGRPFRIYVELEDVPERKNELESWRTFVCFRCLVELLNSEL